jgi:hypothetical protein
VIGARAETVVRTAADLAAFRRGQLPVRFGALRLELPGMSDDEARVTMARLLGLQRECGCAMGALLAYPTTALVVVWQIVSAPVWASSLIARIGVSVAIVMAAGMAGKFLGVTRARRKRIVPCEWSVIAPTRTI